MPNIKSAIKDLRQNTKRKVLNTRIKKKFRSAVKKTRELIASGKKEKAQESMINTMKQLDKAAKKNVIHRNTAARNKSRLAKAINKL